MVNQLNKREEKTWYSRSHRFFQSLIFLASPSNLFLTEIYANCADESLKREIWDIYDISMLTSPWIECVVSVSVEKTGFAYTWVPKGQKLYKVVIFHTPSILLIWDENTCSTNHCFVMILVLPSLDILFCPLCYTRKVILPQVFIYYDRLRPEQSEHTSHTITNVHTMNMLSSYSPGLHSSGTLDKLEL